jgi:hypothetical protein
MALVSSVGERLGVMNRYVIGHDGAVVSEPMELLLSLLRRSCVMDSELLLAMYKVVPDETSFSPIETSMRLLALYVLSPSRQGI